MDTKKLRQKILDLAIRGKLVPQDPNDEPASVLLERIRTEKERLIKEGKIKRSKKLVTDDEIEAPFVIPESWEWVRLEDFVKAITDGDHQPPPQSKTGVPFLVISDVNTGVINFSHARFVSEEYYNNLPAIRRATKGDILFTVTGSYGITILVDTEQNFCFQRHIGLIKTISCSEWITIVLQSDYVHKYCDNVATGTAQKTVSLGHLRDLVIPVPPLSEQKRIVNEIEHWFTLIDELESNEGDLLRAIDKAKSKILDLAIHGKLVPQDPSDEPAIELLKRINPKFEPFDNPHYTNVKRGWCLAKLEDVIELLDNKRIPVKSEEREQRIKNKERLYPYYGATGFVGYIDNYILDGHYILLGEDGAPFEDKHANVAYEVKGKIWVNNHAHILSPKISFKYLLHSLNAVDYTLYAKGTTRLKLTQKDMLNMPIFVPPYQEQFRIVTKIEELFAVFDSIKESLG